MRLVNDKELLLSIWNAYSDLIELKQGFDLHEQIKWEYMKEDFTEFEFNKGVRNLEIIPMYIYHSLGFPYGFLTGCNDALQSSEDAISKLEKTL